MFKDFFDGFQPVVQFGFIIFSQFVFPVSGQSFFSNFIHSFRTNLHFHPTTFRPHYRYVKRFISVGLGYAQPVSDTFGMRFVKCCNGRINHPALIFFRHTFFGFENNTKCQDIVNFFKRNVTGRHFMPNGIDRLYTFFQGKFISHFS